MNDKHNMTIFLCICVTKIFEFISKSIMKCFFYSFFRIKSDIFTFKNFVITFGIINYAVRWKFEIFLHYSITISCLYRISEGHASIMYFTFITKGFNKFDEKRYNFLESDQKFFLKGFKLSNKQKKNYDKSLFVLLWWMSSLNGNRQPTRVEFLWPCTLLWLREIGILWMK